LTPRRGPLTLRKLAGEQVTSFRSTSQVRPTVKKIEIAECLRVYRAGLDSYTEVVHKLHDSRKAADGIPILRRAQRWLEEAMAAVEKLGDGLSLVPELAVQLREERRLYDKLLRQAKRAGVDLRYDDEEPQVEEL
jgi:hypothetical protein